MVPSVATQLIWKRLASVYSEAEARVNPERCSSRTNSATPSLKKLVLGSAAGGVIQVQIRQDITPSKTSCSGIRGVFAKKIF